MKLVPVSEPVPLVPLLKIQIPSEGPLSVNSPVLAELSRQ